MAKVELKMPEDFLERISRINENFDRIMPGVLEAGAKPVLDKAESNLQSVIAKGTKHKSKSTGDLVSAIGKSSAWQDRNGNWNMKVGIGKSKDRKGVSNALKAMVLEYGKSGQPPKPWLKPAGAASKKACISEMKAKLDRELKSL